MNRNQNSGQLNGQKDFSQSASAIEKSFQARKIHSAKNEKITIFQPIFTIQVL